MRQKNRVNKIYKILVDSDSISKETRGDLKPVRTSPEKINAFCKVH